MRVKCTDIVWDGDDDDQEAIADLPTTLVVEVEAIDDLADALSDASGWCVSSFSYDLDE